MRSGSFPKITCNAKWKQAREGPVCISVKFEIGGTLRLPALGAYFHSFQLHEKEEPWDFAWKKKDMCQVEWGKNFPCSNFSFCSNVFTYSMVRSSGNFSHPQYATGRRNPRAFSNGSMALTPAVTHQQGNLYKVADLIMLKMSLLH